MGCKLGFIGVGKMGGAILEGAITKGGMNPKEVGVYDPNTQQLEKYTSRGVVMFKEISELVSSCEMILLAVKPQSFTDILPEIKKTATKDTLLISIAAGITAKQIKEGVGFDCKTVLVMPNTPLLLGEGASALARIEPTTVEEFDEVKKIFELVGVVEEIPSNKLNEIIPVNGSSPAFIYHMADTIVNHADAVGIDKKTAMSLFAQTLIGSAKMLTDSGFEPKELVSMVCSPGGTTIEGMKALEEYGFAKALNKAFEACVQRAEELSGFGSAPSDKLEIKTVDIDSDYYKQILKIREDILRKPIGLELTESDTASDKDAVHFAAIKDVSVIGTVQLLPLDAFNVQMRQLAVVTSSQKTGIGRLLIKATEDYARENNYKRITLNARETAEGFYCALGYTKRGNIFTEKGIAHIAMYIDLDKKEDDFE